MDSALIWTNVRKLRKNRKKIELTNKFNNKKIKQNKGSLCFVA